jgi:hypothetical protein
VLRFADPQPGARSDAAISGPFKSSKLLRMSAPESVQPIRPGLVAILLLAIAACGGAPGANSPSPSTTPADAGSQTASPKVSASAAASPETSGSVEPGSGTGSLCTTGGSPAAGTKLTITDPDIGMSLPAGWEQMDIRAYGALLTQAAAQIGDPRVVKAAEWQGGLIAANVMRVAATGTSEPSGFQAVLIVSVLPVTADLQTTVDFRINEQATNGIPIKVVEVGQTELPIGPAYCAGQLSDVDIGTPSQTIEYIAIVQSGPAISLAATAPVGDTGFPDLVRSVALSLAAD